MLQNPDAGSFFSAANQTKSEEMPKKLGSLTANLAKNLGTIDQQLKSNFLAKPAATAPPVQNITTTGNQVGATLGSISQLLSATVDLSGPPTTSSVVANSIKLARAQNQRMNDVHEHPLGYGFLSNNDHKDLFKTLSDAVELPTDVTQANLLKPQRDAAADMAAGLGQMIAVASVQHPLAGALTLNADALVK